MHRYAVQFCHNAVGQFVKKNRGEEQQRIYTRDRPDRRGRPVWILVGQIVERTRYEQYGKND